MLDEKCTCGYVGCRVPVKTESGEVFVLTKNAQSVTAQQHLQEKIDNASKIEIDGCGKVVKYETPMADKAEDSYKLIIKRRPWYSRLLSWFKSLFRPKVSGIHVIKRSE